MPHYGKPVGSGMESVVRPLMGESLVHKIFDPSWITRNYPMGGRLSWITEKAYALALPIRDVQPPPRGRHGFLRLPPEQWEKITLLLSNHTVDVLRTARKAGIQTPPIFRAVCVRGKQGNYWVLEMTDIRRKGHILVSADKLAKFHKKYSVSNFGELMQQIQRDEQKLAQAGFYQDESHERHGAWTIRINKKTHKGERMLVDATNFLGFYREKTS